MGLKAVQLLQQTGRTTIKHCAKPSVNSSTLPFTQVTDIVSEISVNVPKLFKPLTKQQVANMKPSKFQELLVSRTDIPESFKTIGPFSYSKKPRIHSPEQLSLYDEVNNLLLERNIDTTLRTNFLTNIMGIAPYNCEFAKKIFPKLIKKGYDLDLLSNLNITEQNYKHIEKVLQKLTQIKNKVNTIAKNKIPIEIAQMKKYGKEITPEVVAGIKEDLLQKALLWEKQLTRDICSQVCDSNIKYLDDWFKYTDLKTFDPNSAGIGQIETELLMYWNKDTMRILQEFSNPDTKYHRELLEVVSRRGHDYNSVKNIFGNKKINSTMLSLLEFKNLDKYKNIDLNNFDSLTIAEKKEFINSFFSAISPRKIYALDDDAFNLFKEKVKMFKSIDTTSKDTIKESYYNIIKRMINSIPQSERQPIKTKANWGPFYKKYREQNPIPALVDDLEKLPARTETINGKKYLVSEISSNTELAISGHITGDKDFLIVQALEFTDPEEILCVGTKSLKNKIHYSTNGYSIAVKPRQGQDFWMQAPVDFDSGTAARKCVKDIGQRFKGRNDYYSYIPDLIKKELDLSQREYTKRLNAIKNCTTLDEIGKIDYELEQTIRKILKENKMFEGILRPEPMGVLIPKEIALNEISQEVLDYINLRGIRLIRVNDAPIKS